MPSPSSDQLAIQLEVALNAARESELVAGKAQGQLRAVQDQLAAANLQQGEWDELLVHLQNSLSRGEQFERELEAIKASRSWRLIWTLGAPLRQIRAVAKR